MTHSRKCVLIIDDEPDHRFLLRVFFLKLWSLNVDLVEARNREEAIFLLHEKLPHLILMDLSRSPETTHDLIQQIRALEKPQNSEGKLALPTYPQVKIIVLSTDISKTTRTSTLAIGCDDFICKPYTSDELYQSVSKHLNMIDQGFQAISQPPQKAYWLCLC